MIKSDVCDDCVFCPDNGDVCWINSECYDNDGIKAVRDNVYGARYFIDKNHIADYFDMVKAFHKKYGFLQNEKPTLISKNIADKRRDWIIEEVNELKEAEEKDDIVAIADALGDILYFTFGTAVCYGIPIYDIFSEIHRSNMTKDVNPEKGGKALKGNRYTRPNFSKILSFPKTNAVKDDSKIEEEEEILPDCYGKAFDARSSTCQSCKEYDACPDSSTKSDISRKNIKSKINKKRRKNK